MKSIFKTHIPLTLALILSALLPTALSSCREKQTEDDRNYYSELRSVKKLVVGRMTLSKMATIDDLKLSEAQGLKQTASALLAVIKPGSRKAAYAYDTYLRAYIDLNRLTPADIQLSTDGQTLDLTLPPIEIEFVGRNPEIREEHYRVTGLRSDINADERAKLKEEMNRLLKEEVRNNPAFTTHLTETARTKATAYFNEWGKSQGLNVNIKFKD